MNIGRTYTAFYPVNAQTTAFDIFEILSATDSICVVVSLRIWQTTELGDAQEEQIELEFTRGFGTVTSGSGGTTPTINPHDDGDAAFGGTIECRNTTRLATGTGTLEVVDMDGWNLRMPYSRIWVPEERPVIGPGEYWAVGFRSTPADSVSVGAAITFKEVGG